MGRVFYGTLGHFFYNTRRSKGFVIKCRNFIVSNHPERLMPKSICNYNIVILVNIVICV